MLEYKGFTFFEGDPIRGQIKGIDVEGKLHCNGLYYYFCQDKMMGGAGATTYEYQYGWQFRKKGLDELTDDVEIFIPIDADPKEDKVVFSKDKFDSRFIQSKSISGTLTFKYHNIFGIDCSFLGVYDDSSMMIKPLKLYNKLDDLSEEVKEIVLQKLKRELKRVSCDLLIITYDKSQINTFFEQELNFYRLDTWVCKNSGETKNLLSCHIQ